MQKCVVLFCVWGPHLAIFKAYSWLCLEGYCGKGSGDHMECRISNMGQPKNAMQIPCSLCISSDPEMQGGPET